MVDYVYNHSQYGKMKGSKLYKIYNKDIKIGLFILTVAVVTIVLDIIGGIPAIIKDYKNIQNWVVFIGMMLLGLIFVKMSLFLLNNYKDINKLKKTNPELVRIYENEFESASKIGEDVWMSEHFYYFRTAGNLKVITFDEVKKLRLYRSYITRGGFYNLEVHIENQYFISTASVGYRKENLEMAQECANIIAEKSGVLLSCDL